jgi:hypothetical protein
MNSFRSLIPNTDPNESLPNGFAGSEEGDDGKLNPLEYQNLLLVSSADMSFHAFLPCIDDTEEQYRTVEQEDLADLLTFQVDGTDVFNLRSPQS